MARLSGLSILFAITLTTPSLATDRAWSTNFFPAGVNTISNDFALSGNWNPSPNPGNNDRAMVTNNSAGANQTNIAWRTGDYDMFNSGAGIVVSNGNTAGSGINMFLLNANRFQMQNLVVGGNGMVTITGSGSLIAYSGISLKSGGTIQLNNGTIYEGGEDGGKGSGVQDLIVNGTLIANTGTFSGITPAGGGANHDGVEIANGGKVIANTGSFIMNTGSAGANAGVHGLQIDSGGIFQINSGATFVLNRFNTGGWAANTPDNLSGGMILMNGGSLVFSTDNSGALNIQPGDTMYNNGTVVGNGWLYGSFKMDSGGWIVASNGNLVMFGTLNGSGATITANNNDPTKYGTFRAVSGGALVITGNVASGVGGNWGINSGGTLEVGQGFNVDLGTTFMPGSNLNGTVKINAGGNFTLSAGDSTTAGKTFSQSGTFIWNATNASGNVAIYMANTGGLQTFTNAGTFILAGTTTGTGTLQTGYGGGNSYGFVNSGTILLNSGGTLIFNTADATTVGFSNTTAGTIAITNGSLLRIDRTGTGWGGAQAVNMGTMILSNATFQTATAGSLGQSNLFKNAGTIVVQGRANLTNLWQATMLNAGTLVMTNNNTVLQLGTASSVNWFTNAATGVIILGTNGTTATLVATNGPSPNQFSNLGTIKGQGTMTLGINTATNGQNANFVNSGTLVVTNWGGAAAGTLFVSTGNAFSNGGFSNTTVGTLLIASNSTLTVNRSQNAWAGSGTSVANLGTISLAGGSLNLASDGLVSNAASFINSGTISGWGTIDSVVITTNGGKVFANATNLVNEVGTLTLRVASTTNNSTATLGTIGTNAVLNLIAPGGQNTLINFGTISVSGGSINFGGGAGSITNFFVVAGVGNLANFDIINTGATASIVAQNPISGLSNLTASVGVTNIAILGANNSGGAATLTLGTATDAGLVNNGTVLIQGGFITVTNATGSDAGITNLNGLIVGFGTNLARVANLAGGTVMASNGVLVLGAENNLNLGTFTNFNSAAAIRLTNSILVNSGKIFLNGGGFVLSGSTITNTGTITGPGNESGSIYNDTTGFVAATNGTLNIATNAGESVVNLGTFDISSGSTLSNAPSAWDNTNGTVRLNGGTLTGGAVTNKGVISGNGTIMSSVINAAEGTVRATNGVLVYRPTSIVQSGTMIGGTAAGTYFQATNIAAFFNNNGTMLLDGSGNLAYYILADFSNSAVGVVSGAGLLRTADNVVGGGGANFNIRNMGNILATNGTLVVDPGDGFSFGFNNGAGATVTVANASTFAIARSTNAWLNALNPVNNGVYALNGGTIAALTNVNTGPTATTASLGVSGGKSDIASISNSLSGTILGNGTWNPRLINVGTVVATNGTLRLANTASLTMGGTFQIQNGATLDVRADSGTLFASGQLQLFGGSMFATGNITQVRVTSTGSITGFGQVMTSTNTGSAGGNEFVVSGGTVIATNGTLYLNAGNAFAAGGLSNSANGELHAASGATLTFNRTVNAWNNAGTATANLGSINLFGGTFALASDGTNDSARYVRNLGRIFGNGTFFGSVTNLGSIIATNGLLTIDNGSRFAQNGTLAMETSGTLRFTNSTALQAISFTNGGSILMRGGELQAGVVANTNVIFGFGTISGGGVDNSGAVYASNGTLVVSLSSFTNDLTATLGTLTTNATLDATVPGGASQPLINRGTINLAGGTLLLNGSNSGIISNRTTGTVQGVGEVTQTVINDGTVMSANPVSGLSVFSVGLSDLNAATATLGASNLTTLNVVISGGAGSSFNNNGSVTMLGGTLIISNATPGVITNNTGAFVSGFGTVTPQIYNLAGIIATNGQLTVSLLDGTNPAAGFLLAAGNGTLQISNALVNLGTIGASGGAGGTIQMLASDGVITNRGTIDGFRGLTINNYVVNEKQILVTNGVLTFNAIDGLANPSNILISTTGTLQSNSSNSWANAGSIDLRGGTLRTGGFTNGVGSVWTNTGTVTGFGTIIGGGTYGQTGAGFDKSIANLGTIIVTNPFSAAGGVTNTISTGGATTQDGIQNLGIIIITSNNTLVLSRQTGLPILNTGAITINNGNLTGSGVLSNTLGGVIQGYGTLSHAIVNLSSGTIRATNGLMVMTASVSPVNFGTLEIDNLATLTWNATNSWQNNGTIDLRNGTLRTGGPTNALAGGEPFTNVNYIVGFGTVIGGGAFGTNGPGIDKAIINLGTVIASGGTLIIDTGVSTLSNGIANFGTMIISNTTDTLELRRASESLVGHLNFIENTGTIQINGGTLTANSALTNRFVSGARPGLIQGFGTIAITNDLINSGTIRSTNGVLRFVNPTGGDVLDVRQSGTLAVELSSEMIFGASSNAPLVNSGTILMNGGYLRSGTMTNLLGSTFTGFGTITSPTIINAGTGMATALSQVLHLTGNSFVNTNTGVFGANNGRVIVDGVFTNAGTVSFLNSVGVFSNAVVNRGAWIMDPSTNVFYGDYTVASNGFITMTSGDISVFKSNFVNQSRNSNSYDTVQGKFMFDGDDGLTGTYTQFFSVAGLDMLGTNLVPVGGSITSSNAFTGSACGVPIFGFTNNFALGTLEIGSLASTSTLALVDAFPPGSSTYSNDNFVAGLYVNSFTINAGSLLIISNNVEFYFKSSNGVTGVSFGSLNPGDNVLVLSGGSFHQLMVPEPSVLMLLVLGAVGIYWRRRSRR